MAARAGAPRGELGFGLLPAFDHAARVTVRVCHAPGPVSDLCRIEEGNPIYDHLHFNQYLFSRYQTFTILVTAICFTLIDIMSGLVHIFFQDSIFISNMVR